jgi:hypothetical protein
MRREASCTCGQLRLAADGEPTRIGICHCLACQRRTGSAFGLHVRYRFEDVETSGEAHHYTRVADDDGDTRTIYENRRHAWVGLPDDLARITG